MAVQKNPHLDMFPEFPEFKISRDKTALLIIDMQVLDACWGQGMFAKPSVQGEHAYYKQRLLRWSTETKSADSTRINPSV